MKRTAAAISNHPLFFGVVTTGVITPEVPGEPAGGAAAVTDGAVVPLAGLGAGELGAEALPPPPNTAESPPGPAEGPACALPGVLTKAGILGDVSVGALPAAGVHPEDGL